MEEHCFAACIAAEVLAISGVWSFGFWWSDALARRDSVQHGSDGHGRLCEYKAVIGGPLRSNYYY